MSTATADTGPLVPAAPVSLSTVQVEEVAAWLAYVALEGRYAKTQAGPYVDWWRYSGGRWHLSDESVVRAAIRYALDDAYHHLMPRDTVSARRLDWLLASGGAERGVWSTFARLVCTDRARLGRA